MFGRNSIAAFRSLSKAVLGAGAKPTLFAPTAISRSLHLPRFFSNTAPGFSAAQQELVSALQNEIDAEKKLEAENLGGSVSPSIPGFQITTHDAEVRLKKTHGDEEILVVFNVNHSVEVSEEEETDGLTPIPVSLPPVAIEITKGGKRLCFNVELVPTNDQQYDFCVEEFYVADAAKNNDEAVDDTVYASSGKYIDPSLHDLLFVSYLEERGLDANFCHQLVNFATHYEHARYVSLLENIKSFVNK